MAARVGPPSFRWRPMRAAPRPTATADALAQLVVNVFNHGFSIGKVLTQLLKLTTECGGRPTSTLRAPPNPPPGLLKSSSSWTAARTTAKVPRWRCSRALEHGRRAPSLSTRRLPRTRLDCGAGWAGWPRRSTSESSHSPRVGVPPAASPTCRALMASAAGNSVFETSGNNVGMRAALGEFIVLVQDDQYVRHPGWNSRLAGALRERQVDAAAHAVRAAARSRSRPGTSCCPPRPSARTICTTMASPRRGGAGRATAPAASSSTPRWRAPRRCGRRPTAARCCFRPQRCGRSGSSTSTTST